MDSDRLYVVRLYKSGWVDVTKPISKKEANIVWKEKTKDGTENTKCENGDYYKVFRVGTEMSEASSVDRSSYIKQ